MNNLKTILQGFVVGSTMSIPGISGGTVAIILGIYNKLLYSAGNIFKDFKSSAIFLLCFALGGGIGILTAARVLTFLFTTPAELPLKFAFLGAAAGCIPPIMKQTKMLPLTPKKLLLLTGGIAAAALFAQIPQGTFSEQSSIIADLGAGIILSVALVLPGISASQMLLMLGMYDRVMQSIANGDIVSLIPLCAGLAAGIFLTAKALSALLERFSGIYTIILGFMLFSLTELTPQWSSIGELAIGAVCFCAGFIAAILLNKKENAQTASHDIVHIGD